MQNLFGRINFFSDLVLRCSIGHEVTKKRSSSGPYLDFCKTDITHMGIGFDEQLADTNKYKYGAFVNSIRDSARAVKTRRNLLSSRCWCAELFSFRESQGHKKNLKNISKKSPKCFEKSKSSKSLRICFGAPDPPIEFLVTTLCSTPIKDCGGFLIVSIHHRRPPTQHNKHCCLHTNHTLMKISNLVIQTTRCLLLQLRAHEQLALSLTLQF